MAMKIQYHFYWSFLKSIDNLIFDKIYLRIVLFRWIFPSSVKIPSNQGTSIITMDDSIRIDHRKYLKDEVIPQSNSDCVVRDEKVDDIMHDPTGNCLSCMCSSEQDDYRQIYIAVS
jgi:hypothetical protein